MTLPQSRKQRRRTQHSFRTLLLAVLLFTVVALLGGILLALPQQQKQQTAASALLLVEPRTSPQQSTHKASSQSDNAAATTTTHQRAPIVDILSIGSYRRPEFQDAQQESLVPARNFFRATEVNDTSEPDCHITLTKQDAFQVAKFCRGLSSSSTHDDLARMTVHYARRPWLAKKENPAGWMCAQKRPADALVSRLASYTKMNDWPDHLFVVDDDTYLNVPVIVQELEKSYNSTTARAVAGCRVRSRIYEHNFTIPFGGFGIFLNKAALQNLVRPIHCPTQQPRQPPPDAVHGSFEDLSCWRLQQNSIGEQSLFSAGMSVLDLLHAYTKRAAYAEHKSWSGSVGFCLHSDWLWGYFLNFYPVVAHSGEEFFSSVPQDRLLGYQGSTIYAGRETTETKAARGQCDNKNVDVCTPSSHICHYMTPEKMLEMRQATS